MATKNKSGLPSGVYAVPDRPGLYRIRCMIRDKHYSEYYRTDETGKKKLQSELQKEVDAFRDKIERGLLQSGDVTDKSTFTQAVEWFSGIRKLEIRESTQLADNFIFEHYLVPRLGNFKLKEITSPMITKLLAELLEKGGGGGRAVYAAREDFIKLMYERKPGRTAGGFNLVARELGIGVDNTFVRVRRGDNTEKKIAEKVAKYYGVPLLTAFEKKVDVKPLSAAYVSKITYTLSALFTACVKNGVLLCDAQFGDSRKTIENTALQRFAGDMIFTNYCAVQALISSMLHNQPTIIYIIREMSGCSVTSFEAVGHPCFLASILNFGLTLC